MFVGFLGEVVMMDNDLFFLVCDVELDVSGFNCLLFLLKVKLELNCLFSGGVFKVIVIDVGLQ